MLQLPRCIDAYDTVLMILLLTQRKQSLRTALACLCFSQAPPLDVAIEEFALDTFTAVAAQHQQPTAAQNGTNSSGSSATKLNRVRMDDVIAHICAHPEARCWLHYFSDPTDSVNASALAAAAVVPVTGLLECAKLQATLGLESMSRVSQCSWARDKVLKGEAATVTAHPSDAESVQALAATAEPQWQDAVRSLVPKESASTTAAEKQQTTDGAAGPVRCNVRTELQWVHGYSGSSALGCSAAAVRYTAQGSIVYAAGMKTLS